MMYRWFVLSVAAIPMMFGLVRPRTPVLYWWTTGPLQKIRPYDSAREKLKNPVQISAARNEFESFQIVFRSDLQDIEAVDVDVSDFKSGNNVLPKKNITVYFERYLDFSRPS